MFPGSVLEFQILWVFWSEIWGEDQELSSLLSFGFNLQCLVIHRPEPSMTYMGGEDWKWKAGRWENLSMLWPVALTKPTFICHCSFSCTDTWLVKNACWLEGILGQLLLSLSVPAGTSWWIFKEPFGFALDKRTIKLTFRVPWKDITMTGNIFIWDKCVIIVYLVPYFSSKTCVFQPQLASEFEITFSSWAFWGGLEWGVLWFWFGLVLLALMGFETTCPFSSWVPCWPLPALVDCSMLLEAESYGIGSGQHQGQTWSQLLEMWSRSSM